MTPTPEALAAAMETVRKNLQRLDVDPMTEMIIDLRDHNVKCGLLIRWLVANADRLRVARGLEWSKETLVNKRDRHLVASGAFGTLMTVTEDGQKDKWVYNPDCSDYFGGNNIPCDSLADGKAKCEAIYADRLAAALAPAFPTKGEQS